MLGASPIALALPEAFSASDSTNLAKSMPKTLLVAPPGNADIFLGRVTLPVEPAHADSPGAPIKARLSRKESIVALTC